MSRPTSASPIADAPTTIIDDSRRQRDFYQFAELPDVNGLLGSS